MALPRGDVLADPSPSLKEVTGDTTAGEDMVEISEEEESRENER